MYQIPPDEYRRRLARWRTQPDRRKVETRDARGRPVIEYWSAGVCRLRSVQHRDGWELLADRGVPGYPPRKDHGKIAFHYFGEAGP